MTDARYDYAVTSIVKFSEEGDGQACDYESAVPVPKLYRTKDLAVEFLISRLMRDCRNYIDEDEILKYDGYDTKRFFSKLKKHVTNYVLSETDDVGPSGDTVVSEELSMANAFYGKHQLKKSSVVRKVTMDAFRILSVPYYSLAYCKVNE